VGGMARILYSHPHRVKPNKNTGNTHTPHTHSEGESTPAVEVYGGGNKQGILV